ncbi:MAG: dihydropteroate synthase [Cardiobacteriaceae bacterium]|nr:dihydropteroate synthase [Cardiobacteriaceae bacterium]
MRCGRFTLNLSHTNIMGVLNCTPDSFSDGGQYLDPSKALYHAESMLKAGAHILDVGAESTRPNAQEVPALEEIRRLTPVVKALCSLGVPISIDTKKTAVMQAMLDLGVDMINDVHGLEDEGALELLARYPQVGICIMHMKGMPDTMQNQAHYGDVVQEVRDYLAERAHKALCAGISQEQICLDFGFGFGKTPEQNMALIRALPEFLTLGYPMLLGVSRKSTIGYYLDGATVDQRLIGSVTLASLGAFLGARIVRVHDVKETHQALCLTHALLHTPN